VLVTVADRNSYYEDYEEKLEGQEDFQQNRCDDMIGKYVDDKFIGLKANYDLEKVQY